MVTPMAFTADGPDRAAARSPSSRVERWPAARLRIFLGAFGEPGHAFPMLALGTRLAARGHEVTFETWSRWREHVERGGNAVRRGARVSGVPDPRAAAEALRGGRARHGRDSPGRARVAPDVVVHDILTLAPALGGGARGRAGRDPRSPTSIRRARRDSRRTRSARACRGPRRAGAMWRALERPVQAGLRQGRRELNETRRTARAPAG